MEQIASFFSTLFTLEVTVFGIFTAAILVFVQLVYANYSYKLVSLIFRGLYFWLYILFSIVGVLLTGAINFLAAFSKHDFSGFDFQTNELISNPALGGICLFIFLGTIVFFVLFSIKSLRFLRPKSFLLVADKSISFDSIRKFILNKFGVPTPAAKAFLSAMYVYKSEDVIIKRAVEEADGTEKKDEPDKIDEVKKKAKEQDDQKRYEHLKKEIVDSEDPFELIIEVAERAIQKNDLSTLRQFRNSLIKVVGTFFKDFDSRRKPQEDKWDPDEDLANSFLRKVTQDLESLFELCQKNELNQGAVILTELTSNLCELVIERGNSQEYSSIYSLCKSTADRYKAGSTNVFEGIMISYRKISELLFEKDDRDSVEIVVKDLGWIGERLIPTHDFGSTPIMPNDDYETNFGLWWNTIFSFGSEYNKRPNWYPHFFFDSLFVVSQALIIQLKKLTKNSDLDQYLFDVAYSVYSFTREAIMVGNTTSAELGVMKLDYDFYSKYSDSGLEKRAREVLGLIVKCGLLASSFQDKQKKPNLFNQPVEDEVIERLLKSSDVDTIIAEVYDNYLRASFEGDHKKAWEFVKKLGNKMDTNFGFMFDPVTGENYPDDDPRRR